LITSAQRTGIPRHTIRPAARGGMIAAIPAAIRRADAVIE